MCSQLVEALKPANYRVVVCSAFRDASGPGLAPRQVAIIARNTAYFTWSEPWNFSSNASPQGGFAFAALQVAGHRFGFSCLELAENAKSVNSPAARQWIESLTAYRSWANNRLEGFVAATSGLDTSANETSRLIAAAGFVDPQGKKTPPVSGKTFEAHLVPNQDSPAGLVFSSWPTTCDFDFHPAPVIVIAESPVPTPLIQPASAEVTPSIFRNPIVAWCLGGGVAVVLLAILVLQIGIRRRLARLQTQSILPPIGAGAYNIALMPSASPAQIEDTSPIAPEILPAPQRSEDQKSMMKQGLFLHMAEWLKHAFVQRLLRDREQMMATHQTATTKAQAANERLARLETKIRLETASYEKQIEQLTRELLTAREENLELIRAQIKDLKSAMADAQAQARESEVA
jgi:hypothetical protein